MRKTPSIFAAVGIAALLLGMMTVLLTPQTAVQASLPKDHPRLSAAWYTEGITLPVPATVNDFLLPGTQPNATIFDGTNILSPDVCQVCHANYASPQQDKDTETWHAWQGSMMALAGRDPLFAASLDIANADVEDAGELCLRCHMPRGWLGGRARPSDGSNFTSKDFEGVECSICHRMVDPENNPGNPARDVGILAAITRTIEIPLNGSLVMDPEDYRRGPFDIVAEMGIDPHLGGIAGGDGTLQTPYHQTGEFCGSCHDIANPAFSWDEAAQEYVLNPLDTPTPVEDLPTIYPVERTYSEWKLSAYNSTEGIYNPAMGGNKTFVSTCQDCHMRDVSGKGGSMYGNSASGTWREDMPMHDLTGANTWVPLAILQHPVYSSTFPTGSQKETAVISGTHRARYMLQNAADLVVNRNGNKLSVQVINQTGHKLPTGYPEGRRMWLQVEGYDINGTLIYTSGAYIAETATLITDSAKIYEIKPGITDNLATAINGIDSGPSFHFALNNGVVSDNRIPPRGYNFTAFMDAGAAPYTNWMPDPNRYADGQFWDTTVYTLPDGVVSGKVRLLYQTASKEYVEFLRNNAPPGKENGQILYDLWEITGKSAPEVMEERPFGTAEPVYLPMLSR